MKDVWHQHPNNLIKVADIRPGHRIAFHVNRWHGMYKMQVAKIESLENGSVKIKAGMCTYTFWHCYWHVLAADEKIWLLGSNEDGSPIALIK